MTLCHKQLETPRWRLRVLFGVVLLALVAGTSMSSERRAPTPSADEQLARGNEQFHRGAIGGAMAEWEAALAAYEKAGNVGGKLDAMANLAAGYQCLGQYKAARKMLESALPLAESAHDRGRVLLLKSTLGETLTMLRRWRVDPVPGTSALPGSTRPTEPVASNAEACLGEAMALAEELGDKKSQARILNGRGNLYSAEQRYAEAVQGYLAGHRLAQEVGDLEAEATALSNAALAGASGGLADAAALSDRATARVSALGASRQKAFLLLTIAQADRAIALRDAAKRADRLRHAGEACQQARSVAERIGDRRAEALACGDLGALYELDGQWADALALTRGAAFIAQQIQAPEMLYRWQWQIARLLVRQGETEPAMRAYRSALVTMGTVRYDVALGYGNRTLSASFRETVGPLFFEYADLLLRAADNESDAVKAEQLLKEARATVEKLKSAEVEDYFREECVSIARKQEVALDAVGAGTAVVYIIPLPDRTELLVSSSAGLRRFRAAVGAEALEQQVRELRRRLEERTSFRHLRPAQLIHRWLIEPIEPHLRAEKIDTLVFVPDGALRTVPMGALHDGHDYLIRRYAVAVTPGLTLMSPRPIRREGVSLLMGGVAEGRPRFPALEFVPEELAHLQQLFGGRKLLDREFSAPRFQQEMIGQQYSIVHIASHGQFGREAKDTFVLAYDRPLTLDHLEKLIQPSQFRGRPVELLTLSACQTAAGDDRAALGLAGVAVKAGARSAVATLWFVNDQASAQLVSDFYQQLKSDPELSKAKALQRAQLNLLGDQRYRHPCYWSPYLIIGNWL